MEQPKMRIPSAAMLALAVTTSAVLAAQPEASLSSQANSAFLDANVRKPGVNALPGIQYHVIKTGKGAQPDGRDCATVNYKGSLINGKVFDATKPGEPATFPVGRLIAGWTEALQLMHEGDEWELVIPSGLAYGKRGAGNGVIPPDQTLIFDVALLKVSKPINGQCG
jgi:FKBP-type peptidyl-prolyl cis-trans isomerase